MVQGDEFVVSSGGEGGAEFFEDDAFGERAYELAVHVAQRPHDEAWSVTMTRWADQYPDWSYEGRHDAVRQFRNDARRATRRTLDPLR